MRLRSRRGRDFGGNVLGGIVGGLIGHAIANSAEEKKPVEKPTSKPTEAPKAATPALTLEVVLKQVTQVPTGGTVYLKIEEYRLLQCNQLIVYKETIPYCLDRIIEV